MISDRPLPNHTQVFHYCINQKHPPHADLERYRRLDDGRYKAWFVRNGAAMPTPDDREWLAMHSTISFLFALVARLLTVRTEWSRK